MNKYKELQISSRLLENKLGIILDEATALKTVIDLAYERLYNMVISDFLIKVESLYPDVDTTALYTRLLAEVQVTIKYAQIADLDEKAEALAMVTLKTIVGDNIYTEYSKPKKYYIEGLGAEQCFDAHLKRICSEEEEEASDENAPHYIYKELLETITNLLEDNLGLIS